ncbi:hypothetical protein PoB_005788200 [Plakobranchus ocellatus]|uniref:Kazal-like domain-containing protein n=1 Tax=Plakobranchus ocellatus TaxID=259542 RepID=A0AAV4CIA8_9GAST|nr:hypothetical protein PoB_005788200 [Plakobranchus ocellatus]
MFQAKFEASATVAAMEEVDCDEVFAFHCLATYQIYSQIVSCNIISDVRTDMLCSDPRQDVRTSGVTTKNQWEAKEEWQPTQDKDKWRAFEPVEVPTSRWWEMRLDNNLWEVPAKLSGPEKDTSGELKPSGSGEEAILPSDSTPAMPSVVSVKETKPAKSMALKLAANVAELAEAAEALIDPARTSSQKQTSSSNRNKTEGKKEYIDPTAKPVDVVNDKEDKFPGETGYLRPFYRKGDNNPFVDEEDSSPYYGRGLTINGDTKWRNGRPYLPVLHKDTAPATSARDIKDVNDIVVKEGGKYDDETNTPAPTELITTSTPSSIPEKLNDNRNLNEEIEKFLEDSSETETGNKNGEGKTKEDPVDVGYESQRQPEKLPTPVAQKASGKELLKSTETSSSVGESKALSSVSNDSTRSKKDEMPQADQPFMDWPDWDSSLFDNLYDDEENDHDGKKKTESHEKVNGKKNIDPVSSSNDEKEKKENEKTLGKYNENSSDSQNVEDHDDVDKDDLEDEDDDEEDEDEDYDEDYDSDDYDDEEEIEDDSDETDDEDEEDDEEDDKNRSADSYDDSYYYDDLDDDDDDDEDGNNDDDDDVDSSQEVNENQNDSNDEDRYDVIEGKDGGITISPIKTFTTFPASRIASRKKRLDWDKVPAKQEQPSLKSHYSTGIIYDAPPVHQGHAEADSKPSTSVDTHIKQGESFISDNRQEKDEAVVSENDSDVDGKPSVMIRSKPAQPKGKKGTTFLQLHTESDASTSPNPRPPGVASEGGSTSSTTASTTATARSTTTTTSTTTTATTTTTTAAAAEESLANLPVSYPLEFCQGDFECRAGRTCQRGMCKCVPLSWCDRSVAIEEGIVAPEEINHEGRVCGTDGKHYRSHCHLHRSACITRTHVRVDRHGTACLRAKEHKSVHIKEKSWLMEQERLLHEDRLKQEKITDSKTKKSQADQAAEEHINTEAGHDKVVIPSSAIVHFPLDTNKDEITSSVKKDGKSLSASSSRSAPPKEKCTWSQMNEFKDSLLYYYCHKFVEPNCPLEVKSASPQQGDLRLSGPLSGQDAGGGARTHDRKIPADFRVDMLATLGPTPVTFDEE